MPVHLKTPYHPGDSPGLTEPEAREKYGRCSQDLWVSYYLRSLRTISRSPPPDKSSFRALYFSMIDEEHKEPTVYKLVCVGPEEKVVGVHIIGQGSDEVMQGFGVAVKMGATKADLDNTVAIHPTSAEGEYLPFSVFAVAVGSTLC